jgi:hypothetical protein
MTQALSLVYPKSPCWNGSGQGVKATESQRFATKETATSAGSGGRVAITGLAPPAMPNNNESNRSNCLKRAHFVPPSLIELTFVDKTFLLAIELLEMPVDRIQWSTVAVYPTGEAMTVNGIKGDVIPIDSSILRYLVDKDYAAQLDTKLATTQFSDDELKRIVRDNPPPPEWYAEDHTDMLRESWK